MNPPATRGALEADGIFARGLEAVQRTLANSPGMEAPKGTEWSPDLQLIIGVAARNGTKQVVRFVEISTLPDPAGAGSDGAMALSTNIATWKQSDEATHHSVAVVSRLRPIRVRVFDDGGRLLKEGMSKLPWEILTNGLASTCKESLVSKSVPEAPMTEVFAAGMMRGMMALVTVFSSIQSSSALDSICDDARCAVQMPGFWTMAGALIGIPLSVSLQPRFKDAIPIEVNGVAEDENESYRLPVDVQSGHRILTSMEIVAGPSTGARVLLAGMQSVRAVHPSKPNQEFQAIVLVARRVEDESPRSAGPVPEP